MYGRFSGGKPRQQKSYCRILDYLEDNDPDLGVAIKNCCLEFLFNPKGRPGITFLAPTGKFRQEIIDNSFGDVEEKTKAIHAIKSLVIGHNFDTLEKLKDGPVINALRQKISIKDGDNANVLAVEGSTAKIKVDSKFNDASHKKNLNVYILEGGPLPEGEEAPMPVRQKGSMRRKGAVKEGEKKEGGYDISRNLAREKRIRLKIALEVENLYALDHMNKVPVSVNVEKKGKEPDPEPRSVTGGAPYYEQKIRNVYLEKVLSFINYIFKYCSEQTIQKILLQRILPIVSYENIDFYFIFEPHCDHGNYLVPTDLIEKWYYSQPAFNVKTVFSMIDSHLDKQPGNTPAIYSKRIQVMNEIEEKERARVERKDSQNPRDIAAEIVEVYKEVCQNNRVGSIDRVFTDYWAKVYNKNYVIKLFQDELRWITHRQFARIDAEPVFDITKYREIVGYISNFMNSGISLNKLRLLNPNTLRHSIMPTEKIQEIRAFLFSVYFIYIPMSAQVFQKFSSEYERLAAPSPGGEGIYALDPSELQKAMTHSMQTMIADMDTQTAKDNAQIAIKLLNELKDKVNIDQSLLDQLRQIS